MGSLAADLATLARRTTGRTGEAEVLADRRGVLVVRVGAIVVKAHPARTSSEELAARLTLAAASPEFLTPLPVPEPTVAPFVASVQDRLVTLWPSGRVVDPDDPDAVPWAHAASLLARVHQRSVPADAPTIGGPGRVARGLARLRSSTAALSHPAAPDVLAAAATLPRWTFAEEPPPGPWTLAHGDWHLGQLARMSSGQWLLVDADDLGAGPAVWDLARPAAWMLAGLIAPHIWWEFLDEYHAAGGSAVPADRDPWPALDPPARAVTVHAAAQALVAASSGDQPLDEAGRLLVDACRRIGGRG